MELTITPLRLVQSSHVSVAMFIDVRDRIEAKQQLRTLAYYDALKTRFKAVVKAPQAAASSPAP